MSYTVTVGPSTKRETAISALVTVINDIGVEVAQEAVGYDGSQASLELGCKELVRRIEAKIAVAAADTVAEGTVIPVAKPVFTPPAPTEEELADADFMRRVVEVVKEQRRQVVFDMLPPEMQKECTPERFARLPLIGL